MEVTPEQLLNIFKAAYRVGEAKKQRGQTEMVASNSEIEADAVHIIGNILGVKTYFFQPRQGGKTKQLEMIKMGQDLYQGVF